MGGSALAGAAVLSGGRWLDVATALAQGATPLSFQLSWIKSIQYGGYFAGIENNIFKKYGIDPTFNSGGPNVDAVANVAGGRSVLGDRPIGPLLVARDKGIPIKVIGTVFQRSPFSIMSLAAKPIRSVKELEGKTIAVSTSARPLILNLLRDAGADARSVNIVPSSPDPAALVSGQIDAYSGYSTNQGVILQTRGVDLFILNVHDLGIPETAGTLYGREDFLAANRDLVVRFLRAAVEAWRWALDHPEETAKLMVEKYGNPGLDYKAQLTEIKASRPFIEAGPAGKKGLLALDVALYARIIDLYRKVDIVKSPMKAEDLCDPSYIDTALQS
jgi:NitT/TauT family transport system substrate-binding protein